MGRCMACDSTILDTYLCCRCEAMLRPRSAVTVSGHGAEPMSTLSVIAPAEEGTTPPCNSCGETSPGAEPGDPCPKCNSPPDRPEPILRAGWDHVACYGSRVRDLVQGRIRHAAKTKLHPLEPYFYIRGDVIVFRDHFDSATNWWAVKGELGRPGPHESAEQAMAWAEEQWG